MSPLRTCLPREVLLWLLNLELKRCPTNLRRDFSNGFLVADILSRYHPQVFLLYSFRNGSSLSIKQDNWTRIQKFLQKLSIILPQDLINGTINLEMGAAEKLLVEIYSIFTKKSPNYESDLSAAESELSEDRIDEDQVLHHEAEPRQRTPRSGQATVVFKEIKVLQPARRFTRQ